ncbi:hypothetical protein SSP531S_18890 [Streptomyces spongiicola]|uniref:Integral membrane protein n=1 Tax=Streptomyces spongiicola TaxID=1690221 RepID=A0A388SV22_9ACTN|nr:DUF6113 family protein [Streptomyces spongiicola]GBQ00473.1 hypothetical protein SSP531S_18890 [Streptomyces spongiicola]
MSGSGAWPARPPKAVRIAAYVGLAALGVAVGAAGSLVQAAWFPLGLLLALLGAAALFYGGLRATGTQLGVVAPAAGWVASVLLLSAGRPEGDGLFTGGLGEIVFLFGGAALAVMCATMTRLPQPGGSSGPLGK